MSDLPPPPDYDDALGNDIDDLLPLVIDDVDPLAVRQRDVYGLPRACQRTTATREACEPLVRVVVTRQHILLTHHALHCNVALRKASVGIPLQLVVARLSHEGDGVGVHSATAVASTRAASGKAHHARR